MTVSSTPLKLQYRLWWTLHSVSAPHLRAWWKIILIGHLKWKIFIKLYCMFIVSLNKCLASATHSKVLFLWGQHIWACMKRNNPASTFQWVDNSTLLCYILLLSLMSWTRTWSLIKSHSGSLMCIKGENCIPVLRMTDNQTLLCSFKSLYQLHFYKQSVHVCVSL